MAGRVTLQGRVVGSNELSAEGRTYRCWEIMMWEATALRPLDLLSLIHI